MTSVSLVTAALLRERRFRSFIALFSVAIAAALSTISLSMTKRLHDISAAFDNGRLLIRNKIPGAPLPFKAFEQITHVPGIKPLYFASFRSMEINNSNYQFGVVAIGPDIDRVGNSSWWSTTPEVIECLKKNRSGIIVSDKTMRRLGWHVGQTDFAKSEFGSNISYLICGESTGFNPGFIYLRADYFDDFQLIKGNFSFAIAECDTPDRRCTKEIAKRLDQTSLEWSSPTQSVFEQQSQERLVRLVSAVPNLLSKVSLLAILITILISASTLGMSLEERRGEFAVLRALGYRRVRILGLILAESSMLCVLGGLIGSVMPFLLFYRTGFTLGPFHARDVPVDPTACVASLLVSLAIGVLVALLPALRTLRHDVINELNRG